MNQQELLPHLFRAEFSKITAVLCKHFGLDHIETAEDIASETFFAALESWPHNGIPENPTGWLYTVAKNKARNFLHRHKIYRDKIASEISDISYKEDEINIDLSEQNINDSQLNMLFAICHLSISKEAQICMALRILCGFGIEEIANALLTTKDSVNKRLYRAKEKLRLERVSLEIPRETDIQNRLEIVLTTLYLLFNEGYYSESHDAILREDLCLEAMRLVHLLLENELTNQPEVNALLALMCFHASRFASRKNDSGQIVLYQDQDESQWNQELVAKGAHFLQLGSRGNRISKYHLEATIAWWHTRKADTPEKWENILQLYNLLLQVEYSPIAALNRTFALSKVSGKEKALAEAEKLQLTDNHYYFTLLGELYSGIDNQKAKEIFQKGISLAKTNADKQLIQAKIDRL